MNSPSISPQVNGSVTILALGVNTKDQAVSIACLYKALSLLSVIKQYNDIHVRDGYFAWEVRAYE